jgi:two-component system, OmpR family, response regulator ResD
VAGRFRTAPGLGAPRRRLEEVHPIGRTREAGRSGLRAVGGAWTEGVPFRPICPHRGALHMARPRVLYIEDDESACGEVAQTLELEGFAVTCVRSGADGVERARQMRPDLILLDLILPEMDGLEVCRQIRAELNTPIIVLSVKGDEVDRVVGLEIGADDYLGKPFSPRELVARVRAMLRRSSIIRRMADRKQALSFPGLEVDLPTRTVVVDGEVVHLTPKEFDLLYHLGSQPRHVYTREQILQEVWGYSSRGGDLRTVDTHVKRLRKKLEEGRPDHPWSLATVWGVGYRLDVSA